MRGVFEGFQPVVEPDHAHAQAHRLQALLVRPVREGVPEEGRPEEAQGVSAPFDARGGVQSERGVQDGGGELEQLRRRCGSKLQFRPRDCLVLLLVVCKQAPKERV